MGTTERRSVIVRAAFVSTYPPRQCGIASFTQDLAKTASNVIAKGFFTLIHLIVPNFGNFQFTNPLINPTVQVKSEAIFLTSNIIYALVYAAFLLIIAVIALDRREV